MTWFKKIGAEFKRLFGKVPSWDKTASAALTIIAPLIEGLLAAVDPAAATLLNPVISRIQTDLATASVIIQEGVATPTLNGLLSDIKTNLGSILEVGAIKDPATVAKVTEITGTVIAEVEAIEAAMSTVSLESQAAA